MIRKEQKTASRQPIDAMRGNLVDQSPKGETEKTDEAFGKGRWADIFHAAESKRLAAKSEMGNSAVNEILPAESPIRRKALQ